jgi:hypothetical protein
VTSGRRDRSSPSLSNPVRPSPPLQHHAGRCGDIPTLLGRTGTRHRHNNHCATYRPPVNGILELAHHGGRSTNRYTAALEATPVRAQDAPRLNRSRIRQDGRQLRSTVRHTATRLEIVQRACKPLPPWPIKGGAAPQPRGHGTTDSNHSRALRLLHDIGTWRPHLLSRLACIHPSTSTTVQEIQCPEHSTAGRTAPAGTRIKQVSLVA